MREHTGLTKTESAFVEHYMELGNAQEAYRRTFNVSPATAPKNFSQLASGFFRRKSVQMHLKALHKKLEARILLKKEDLVQMLAEVATADPRELSELYINNCRYCHGIEHRYQWMNSYEFAKAMAQAIDHNNAAQSAPAGKRPPQKKLPVDDGGYGFNLRARPNPNCPHCLGVGVEEMVIKDTRDMSPAAARLYGGVKQTKNGIELITRNQDAAIMNIAKMMGWVQEGPVVNVAVNQQVAVIPDDPIAAARVYQDLMKD